MPNNQRGAVPVLILVAIVGVIAFIVFSSSAPFKNSLLNTLFPKPSSHAAQNSVQLGSLNLTASGSAIAVKLPIAGDDNNNATVSLEYKKTTDTNWTTGPILSRSAVQGVSMILGDVKAATTQQTSVPDSIIIKFKPEIPNEDRQALLSK